MTPAEVSRFLQRYAKRHAAGAFSIPAGTDLARLHAEGRESAGGTVAFLWRTVARPSRRRDWTGATIEVPAGTTEITRIGMEGTSPPLPDLGHFDLVCAYRDDLQLCEALAGSGREVWAVQISAASELLSWWARPGWSGRAYEPVDLLTFAEMPAAIPEEARDAILAEVDGLDGWTDDYPFYSDGSWSALSLAGFDRDDPTVGVKPAEMAKAWKADHPEMLARECGWTVLAEACPTAVSAIEAVPWWSRLERVRFLRMSGQDGRGGVLRRHTDITDRAGGTLPGQVVRFHVPLRTDPAIKMHTWDLDGVETCHHLAPWRAWYLDARKPHAVTNPTGTDRIHLTVDVVVDETVRAVLQEAAR